MLLAKKMAVARKSINYTRPLRLILESFSPFVVGSTWRKCFNSVIHNKFQGKGRNIRHETSQYSVSSDQYINQVSSYFRHFVTTSFFLVHICLKFKTLKNSLMFELYEISNDICQTLIEIFRR